jgi:hypothetical protein
MKERESHFDRHTIRSLAAIISYLLTVDTIFSRNFEASPLHANPRNSRAEQVFHDCQTAVRHVAARHIVAC